GIGAVGCSRPVYLAVGPKNVAVLSAAQSGSVLDQRLQDGLQVEGGAADNLEHLGGGCLLLQRFGQLAVAGFDLQEQPYVLDGDDGLVGEGPDQLDLPLRDRLDV